MEHDAYPRDIHEQVEYYLSALTMCASHARADTVSPAWETGRETGARLLAAHGIVWTGAFPAAGRPFTREHLWGYDPRAAIHDRLEETLRGIQRLDIDQEHVNQGLLFSDDEGVDQVLMALARLGVCTTRRKAFALWSYVSSAHGAAWLVTVGDNADHFLDNFAVRSWPYDPGPGPVRDGRETLEGLAAKFIEAGYTIPYDLDP